MRDTPRDRAKAEVEALRARLEEAQETLDAIRRGEVDALVVKGARGEKVYTLKGAEEPYRVMVEAMNDGAVTFTLDGTILYCNVRFAEMMKAGLETVIGSALERYISPADAEKFAALLARSQGEGTRQELSMLAFDGTVIPVTMAAHHLADPGVESIVAVVTDLTEIMAAEDKLRELSVRDALTGLFNRRYMDETLEREVARAGREDLPVSVVMMDIDFFKEINDVFGHKAGDAMLQALGRHLGSQARHGDVACRYGGEELHVTVSAGVAAYPADGPTADAILIAADRALYAAKAAGRNRVMPAS